MNKEELKKYYREREEQFASLADKEAGLIRLSGWLRLAFFVLLVISVVYIVKGQLAWIAALLVSLVGFAYFIRFSLRHQKRKRHYESLVKLNANEIMALDHNYSHFDKGDEFISNEHNFVIDLDIFGRGSLFQYISRSFTPGGRKKLANWFAGLLQDRDKIYSRQEAAKELSGKETGKNERQKSLQEFQALAMQLEEDDSDRKKLESWLIDTEPLFSSRLIPILAYILPVVSATIIVLSSLHILDINLVWPLLLIPLFVVGAVIKRSQSFQRDVTASLRSLGSYRGMIEHIEGETLESNLLMELKNRLFTGSATGSTTSNTLRNIPGNTLRNTSVNTPGNPAPIPASKVISQLEKLLGRFDTRNNMIMGVVLNALFLWDIHCLISFDKWRSKYSENVFTWLDVIAEYDALGSLATFSFNHASYCFPEFNDEGRREFKEMGHPLLDPAERVDNNMEMEKGKGVFLVTGPNMAGKSTFLRAVGVNLVLSQMGAPVCASRFVSVPARLFTSMRTTDSLQDSESYFFSELKRLRQMFDMADENERMFFLLDEILRGTNSNDKTKGSREVILRLADSGSCGMVATHDLALSGLEGETEGRVLNKCFDARIENDNLEFDYKLLDGYSQNMNATFLMKKMGIIRG